MAETSDSDLMRTWARLIRVKQSLESAVERDLKHGGALPLAWYDVLLELSRAPEGWLSPRELEQEMLIAQYNLSRLLDRLEKAKLVRRLEFPGDARRQLIAITDKGRERRKASWPIYRDAVQRHAGGKHSAAELSQLLALLGRFLTPA